MINYEWVISAIDCKLQEETLKNVVLLIHWRLIASNEEFSAETYSCTHIPKPNGSNFTPYEELTKEQVVNWVVSILSEVPESIDKKSQLDIIKESLNKDLELQANPIEVNLPLPFLN